MSGRSLKACYGPVSYYLGPGDTARPVGRGRAAFQRRAGAERQDGGTALGGAHQHDYACMLLARRHPGDQAKAQALLALALATAQELGMTASRRRSTVSSLQSQGQHPAARSEPPASPLPLRRTPHAGRRTLLPTSPVSRRQAYRISSATRAPTGRWPTRGSSVGSKRPRVSTTSRRSCAPLAGNSMSPIWQRSPPPPARSGARPPTTLRPETLAAQHLRVTGPGMPGRSWMPGPRRPTHSA